MAPHRELDMSLCSVFFLQDQWKQYISEIRLQETGRDKYSPVSPSLAMTGKHDIFYVCLNIKTLRFCSMFWMDPFPGIFLDKCCIIPLYFCGGKGNRRYIPCAFFGICVVFSPKYFVEIYFILSLFTFLLLTFPNVFMPCGFSLQRIHDVFAFSIPL